MTKYFLSLFFVTLIHQKIPAQTLDRLWLTGNNEFPGVPSYGHAQLRFQGDSVLVEPASLAFNFESTMAATVDSNGQLLFYTNGCAVANRDHQLMPNGTDLNPGALADQVCPTKGYIVPQGALALPNPGNARQFYLLHLAAAYEPVRKLRLGPLYFSVVDMDADNSLGDVVSKNNILLDGDLGAFSTVRHGNGRDWWIVVPEFGNHAWHTFLLSPPGLEELPVQTAALQLPDCEKYMATAIAPTGERVANWGDCKITVLGFDRCSGAFGPALELPAPAHWIPGGGVAFSPSGRYLYAASQHVLFRADLHAAVPVLDTMRFSYDPTKQSEYDVPGNTFHYLVNGPDGRIYGNIPSRAPFLHLLNNPDGPTRDDLDFAVQGLKLPVTGVRTLPHLPNYRLFDLPGSPCDTLGISVATHTPPSAGCGCRITPNPATMAIWIEVTGCQALNGALFDLTGRRMREIALAPGGSTEVDISDLAPGMYFVQVQARSGQVATRALAVLR